MDKYQKLIQETESGIKIRDQMTTGTDQPSLIPNTKNISGNSNGLIQIKVDNEVGIPSSAQSNASMSPSRTNKARLKSLAASAASAASAAAAVLLDDPNNPGFMNRSLNKVKVSYVYVVK